jgi:hypothetical protein
VRQQISISVPEELHKRLEKYRESINLSEIFRAALSAKLDEIESRRKDKKMETVIEKLRREKKEYENEAYQAGQKSFDDSMANWSYVDLLKLVAAEWPSSTNWRNQEEGDMWGMLLAISETDESDWAEVEGLDKQIFASGFLARAKERWETEIKDQLES